MFLTSKRGYRGTAQTASGDFLILFTNENAPRNAEGKREIRAIVRKVAMHQCGHFMMGATRLLGVRFSLSGTYGGDGLTCDVTTYARHGAPVHPGEFDSREALEAFYAEVERVPWTHAEKAPGLWDRLHVLPDALTSAFWKGGGHNEAGSEGPSIHAWATENAKVLRHLKEGMTT